MIEQSNYVSSQLAVIKGLAERGLKEAWPDPWSHCFSCRDGKFVDLFQRLLDELERTKNTYDEVAQRIQDLYE